jgi:hypothetical protein
MSATFPINIIIFEIIFIVNRAILSILAQQALLIHLQNAFVTLMSSISAQNCITIIIQGAAIEPLASCVSNFVVISIIIVLLKVVFLKLGQLDWDECQLINCLII